MDAILQDCGLLEKYQKIFIQEGITLERFGKLAQSNNHGVFSSAFMEKCQLTCGDFIDLICSWERYNKE